MKINQLTKTDVKDILGLYHDNFNDGWTENMLNSGFDGGRLFAFGTLDEHKLLGAITISLSLDDADIEGIVVDREFRCKGIGFALIQKAHEFIKENGKNRVLLEVREANEQAIALYLKAGYKKISVRKSYYSDGENALVMEKEL